MSKVVFKSLGITKYSDALAKMKGKLGEKNFRNEIWFLEHFKVFTLGTAANKAHVLDPKGIPIYQSDRGGEVTYHGPGQLVIYFLLDFKKLNMGPKTLVESLQRFVQSMLDEFEVESSLIAGAPGVYIDDKKIASIGLRISNGKTYHGISINIDMDLEPFSYINPCGYEGLKVVQLKDYVSNISIKDVEKLAIKKLENIF